MNLELVQAFTPKNKLGESDFRYESDLLNIFESIRPEVLKGLGELKTKTTELEVKYGSLALEFCINWFDYTENLIADDSYNKYNYRSKGLKKQLSEGLKKSGFKPNNVTKILGAAQLIKRLKDNLYIKSFEDPNKLSESKRVRDILDFINPLPISSKYLLGGMTDIGIEKAMSYQEENKEWDPKTDTFPSKPLTVRVLEELKQQYPINPNENRGGWKKNQLTKLDVVPDIQEPITIDSTEIKEVTQESIARDIVSLAKQLNTADGWKNQNLRKILKEAEGELMSISHIATLPIKELTPN
jgi:hypothetical protein